MVTERLRLTLCNDSGRMALTKGATMNPAREALTKAVNQALATRRTGLTNLEESRHSLLKARAALREEGNHTAALRVGDLILVLDAIAGGLS